MTDTPMTPENMPVDTPIVLTRSLDRLFKAGGCRPTCHVCFKGISLGSKFKLCTSRDRDVMLCLRHTVKHLQDTTWYPDTSRRKPVMPVYAGYSRPTKLEGST